MRLMPPHRSGPAPNMTDADVFWILHTLDEYGRIGRKNLTSILDLGEGSLRGVLGMLTDSGLVDTFQTGMALSERGAELIGSIPIVRTSVELPDSVLGEFQESVIVKGVTGRVTSGQRQRDIGMMQGALGCTTLVYRNGTLTIPPGWNMDHEAPMDACTIRRIHEFTEDDVVIIGGADNLRSARNAAVAAALDLI